MSPVDEYKKLEKRFVARCRTVCRNAAAGAHELFSILFSRGRQRFTVMFIPHSEKRSFSFKLSFFLLLFIVVLTIGVTSSFVYLAVRQGGNNRLLAEKTSALKKNEADLELLRDEIAEISQTSGVFQLALKNAVSALEMAGADDFTAEGGGFSSFYEFNDEDQGGLAELGELQSLRALLEQSTDEMDTTTRLLVSVNNLLVQLPTLWPLEGVHGQIGRASCRERV